MSDIADFIIKNFRSLQPTDYLLLSAFAALTSIGIFLTFRAMYAARFAAQKDLIDLHAQRSTLLADQLQSLKTEKAELADLLKQAKTAIDSTSRKDESPDDQNVATKVSALALMAGFVVTAQERLTILYQFLIAHNDLRLPDKHVEAREAAAELSDWVSVMQSKYHLALAKPQHETIDDLFALLQTSEVARAMQRARDATHSIGLDLQVAIRRASGA